ncbi:hypothetical protein KCU77_g17807, partial [Aureobasidium melanogenum]
DKCFSVRRAPYLISYATYVAATIHVRIAATRASTSEAHEHLRICLAVFDQNSATNHAVKKASIVIESLKKRMGIRDPLIDHPSSEVTPRPQSNTFASPNASGMARSQLPIDTMINHEPTMVAGQFDPDLDVDTIIHSFMHEQQQLYGQPANLSMPSENAINTLYGGNAMPHTTQGEASDISLESYDDALFGFNASAFDWFYPNTAPGSYPQH